MRFIHDQIGRQLEIASAPKCIVSLVPSQTELLFDLGLEDEVAGITKFCVHPEHWFRTKTRIGGTKALKADLIASLHPDLIIANKEENLKEQVEPLAAIAPVFTSDISTLPHALEMIRLVGILTGKETAAENIRLHIQQGFDALTNPFTRPLKTAYLIWRKPYMSIGGDTFIHDMLSRCGLLNIFSNKTRYPETTVSELRSLDTELVLLSSEPYPFNEQHLAELQKELPAVRILPVDGEMFSWYGSRLLQSPAYFTQLLKQIG